MRAIWLITAVLMLFGSFSIARCQGKEGEAISSQTSQKSVDDEQGEKLSEEQGKEGRGKDEGTVSGEEKTEPSSEPQKTSVETESQSTPSTTEVTQSPAEQIKKRKKRPFEFKISAHGYASFQYQVGSTVQGTEQGRQVYRYENYGLSKGFNAYGSLQVDWQIGNFSVKGEWTPARYSPTAQRFRTEYNAGSTKFTFGNLFLSLQGNQFVSFSRYAQGLQIEHKFGRSGDLVLVTFETPSQIVTDTFQGNNSPGPYFLRRSPIIEGSEQVRLDERPLRRGVDYTIDYNYGQIMFATPIPPTSTIAVSYESVGYGGTGRFIGLRSNWKTGPNSRLGITFLTQNVPFTVTEKAERFREEFLGNGTTGPFLLQVRPVAVGSEKVFVNGVQQTRDLNYRIDYAAGIVTFLQPVPAGAIVVVEYYRAAATKATVGTLRLVGLDWNGELGKIGRLSWQFGMSSGGDRNGWASEVRLNSETQRLAYTLRWQKVGSGFTRIENTDFFRNDSGLSAELRYELLQGLSLVAGWQNSKTAGGRYFGIGASASTSESRNRDLNLSLSFERPKLPRLQINHQRLRSSYASDQTSIDTSKTFTTVYFGYRLGHFSLDGAWERSDDSSKPKSQSTEGISLTAMSAETDRKRFSFVFQPGSKLSIALDWTQNSSDSPEQQYRSKATQRVFSVNYTPWQKLQFSFSHQKLSGAASVSSLLSGTVLTGTAGGVLSGVGFGYTGLGTGWGTGYGTGFGGYGTFGVGTTTRPSYGWGSTSGWGSSTTSGWDSTSWSKSSWDTPSSRMRQIYPTNLSTLTRRGNESTVTTFGVQWTPFQRLVLSADLTMNSDKGSELVGSLRQKDLSLSGSWQVSRKLNLFSQFTRSRTTYLDELNDSLTLMGMFGLTWGDYQGFNLSLNYQRLRMQNLRIVNRVPQLEETNYSAITASLQIPITKRIPLRVRAARLQNRSPAGVFGGRYRVTEVEAELTYNFTRNLGLGIVWTLTKRKGDKPEQDYSASVLRAALTLQF
ncbi:cell surface protein SprA [Candidatus Fervidibacteria bacterium JGI MDM2 JNZ-1-D12]